MKTTPLVTILINNYNYDHFLRTAIESALSQTYKELEVIVVDDGSTDNSRKIIERYGNRIIPVLKRNNGQASAFNVGFAKSTGDIICFLDSDDYFLPNKIETVVRIFKKHTDLGWLFHSLKLSGADIYKNIAFQAVSSGVYDIRKHINQGKLRNKLTFSIPATSGICFKRRLLKQILPMPELIKITSDDYLKYSALFLSKGFVLTQKLAVQRIHENNAYTLRKDRQQLAARTQIITAYYLRKKFPFASKLTNKIFALGVSLKQTKSSDCNDLSEIISSYLSPLKISEKIDIKLRILYYRIKRWQKNV